jgi:hypothetical protein
MRGHKRDIARIVFLLVMLALIMTACWLCLAYSALGDFLERLIST